MKQFYNDNDIYVMIFLNLGKIQISHPNLWIFYKRYIIWKLPGKLHQHFCHNYKEIVVFFHRYHQGEQSKIVEKHFRNNLKNSILDQHMC